MTLWSRLKEKLGEEESIYRTLAVLGYQFGDLQKYITYSDIYKEYSKAYRGLVKAALADVIVQAELICERFGWNFDEIRQLGRMRFLNSDEPERRTND